MSVDLICPFCRFSKTVPEDKIPLGAKWATCPRCHQRFEFRSLDKEPALVLTTTASETGSQEREEEEADDSQRNGAPWENRSGLGIWQGIYQTFKQVLFSPEVLFKNLTYQGGMSEPFAFGLLVGSLGSMFNMFWQALIMASGLITFGEPLFSGLIIGRISLGLIFFIALILIPIRVTLGMFISSIIFHVLLLIVRGGGNGFEATFRVVSYSQAAKVWGLVPFLGGWVAWVWQLVVQIVGFREIHETSYLKVIAAFLIPVFCILFLVIIAITLAFFYFSS
ncbi:MAG: YIP1 family protein [Desulfatiglans sp.]|jgi:hypothetical protein|nr:YIP1 family protein [Thermodesulfobacteriota bacterium]MEE4352435.1 YIP1 family protein [Desulfatiglans sp.]